MPRYSRIRFWEDDVAAARTLERILALRARLRAEIPARSPGHLLLATWNIRDFDSNRWGHGPRLEESFYYLAEVISAFDLVAVQEVNRDLRPLEKLMGVLGHEWTFICTDTTEGTSGNNERMAFLYRPAAVRFRNIAGEVVLPGGQEIVGAEGPDSSSTRMQFARTPFVVAFQAGWFKFNLCTVHIYFGDDTGAPLARRVEEIRRIAAFFKKRQAREHEDFFLLGDFNVVSPDHETMKALEKEGFVIPPELASRPSNFLHTKHYDQIALRVRDQEVQLRAAGVFDPFQDVFRPEDLPAYRARMRPDLVREASSEEAYYLGKWRTWQVSDHLPMWVQLEVDFTESYLGGLLAEARKKAGLP